MLIFWGSWIIKMFLNGLTELKKEVSKLKKKENSGLLIHTMNGHYR